jgi:hypothetical protein
MADICGRALEPGGPRLIRFKLRFCGDCDGGGLGVTLAKDDKSATVELERIRIWHHKDQVMSESLEAGEDDKAFRLDRASLRECMSL